MKRYGWLFIVCGLLGVGPVRSVAEPKPAAIAGFNRYVAKVEARLGSQHRSREGFLVRVDGAAQKELRAGQVYIERVTPESGNDLPGALLHDWRGTAFIPRAKAVEFERLLRDFNGYPKRFAPQVLRAKVLGQHGDVMQAEMRVRQKHVLTVVMDTTYDVTFGRLDAQDGYSSSRSTRIAEIDAPGTNKERVLGANEEHGFLWRLNTYWTYAEGDGGLYIQIESVSLSRSIPSGLGWALRPFVESVPRESLEFTLRSAYAAMRG